MKTKIVLAAALIAVVGWLAASGIRGKSKQEVAESEIVMDDLQKEAVQKAPQAEVMAAGSESKIETVEESNSEKKETVEEQYKKQGFVQDPNNSNQLMKKEIDKDGKEKTIYVDKYDEGFEPTRKTIKNAMEVLEMKSDLNPIDEMAVLRPFDMNLQENLMLMGKFRDVENDLEIFFSPLVNEDGSPRGEDIVCFISPKLKINIQKGRGKSVLRADDTGYGVVKLNDSLYARFMWSFEKSRTLHGDILTFKDGSFEKTNTFTAKQLNYSKGEKHNYCK